MYATEIVAGDMQMLGAKPEERENDRRTAAAVAPDAPAPDDDVPF